MNMELTECSETSAHKIHAPGNHPKERSQHSEHRECFEINNLHVSYERTNPGMGREFDG